MSRSRIVDGFDIETTKCGEYSIDIRVFVNGVNIWPLYENYENFSFDADEVLSFLVDSWEAILFEENYPTILRRYLSDKGDIYYDLSGGNFSSFLKWAKDELYENDTTLPDDVVSSLSMFLYRHNFTGVVGSGFVDDLFFIRSEHGYSLSYGKESVDIEAEHFIKKLTDLGNECQELLSKSRGEYISYLVNRWDDKKEGKFDFEKIASFSSGIPLCEIKRNEIVSKMFDEGFSIGKREAANDCIKRNRPILAAARSSGALGVDALAKVLREIKRPLERKVPDCGKGERDSFKRKQRDLLKKTEGWEQGWQVADLLRKELSYSPLDKVELREIVKRFGIMVRNITIGEPKLSGIAVADSEYGPMILLNEDTEKCGRTEKDLARSMNFTLAHELGHILLDYDTWPVLSDVVEEQRVPKKIEKRANAFAMYLLLPIEALDNEWKNRKMDLTEENVGAFYEKVAEKFNLPKFAIYRQLKRTLEGDPDLDVVKDISLKIHPEFRS